MQSYASPFFYTTERMMRHCMGCSFGKRFDSHDVFLYSSRSLQPIRSYSRKSRESLIQSESGSLETRKKRIGESRRYRG